MPVCSSTVLDSKLRIGEVSSLKCHLKGLDMSLSTRYPQPPQAYSIWTDQRDSEHSQTRGMNPLLQTMNFRITESISNESEWKKRKENPHRSQVAEQRWKNKSHFCLILRRLTRDRWHFLTQLPRSPPRIHIRISSLLSQAFLIYPVKEGET